MIKRILFLLLTVALVVSVNVPSAQAYIGPGAGITVIGTFLALIGAFVLAIIGFVWYPIKRFRARQNDKKKQTKAASE